MRKVSIVIYSLAILALALTGLFIMERLAKQPQVQPREVGRHISSRYGYFLASWRASVMDDFPVFIEIYPKAMAQGIPDHAERLFMVQMLRGEEEAARVAARKMMETRPSHVLAAVYLSYLYFKEGNYELADQKLLDLGAAGNNFMIHLLRAWTLAAKQDYDGAMALFEKHLNSRAFDKVATVHLGLLASIVGNLDYANEMFEIAASQMQLDLLDLENIAAFYIAQNRRADARQLVSDALLLSPSSLSISELLRRIDRGWVPTPITTARQGYTKALFDLSTLAFGINNRRPSETYMFYLTMALGLDVELQIARLMKAEAYRMAGRPDIYRRIIGQIPPHHHLKPIAKLNWATELLRNDDRRGIAILKEMIRGNPNILQPYMLIGDFYRRRGNYRQAIRWYTRGINENPGSAMMPEIRLARAMAFELSGDDDMALLDFEAAARSSQLPALMNNFGYFLITRGLDLYRGKRFIRIALIAEPSNPYFLDSYGVAHYLMGNYEDAVRLLEGAYALAPRNPIILRHLGDAYWAVGRRREAGFAWQKAINNLHNNRAQENITEAELRERLARR